RCCEMIRDWFGAEMMAYLLVAGVVLVTLVVGVIGLVTMVVERAQKALHEASKERERRKTELRASQEAERAASIAAAEQARIEDYRAQHPVRLIGIPNPDAYHRRFDLLDEFTASADAYRPKLSEELRFRTYTFPSHMFDFNRPHPGSLSNIEPRKI